MRVLNSFKNVPRFWVQLLQNHSCVTLGFLRHQNNVTHCGKLSVTCVFILFMFCKSFSGQSNQNCQIHPEGPNLYLKLCLLHRGKNKITVADKIGRRQIWKHTATTSWKEINLPLQFSELSFSFRLLYQEVCVPFLIGGAWCGLRSKCGCVGRGHYCKEIILPSAHDSLVGTLPHIPQAPQIQSSNLIQMFSHPGYTHNIAADP